MCALAQLRGMYNCCCYPVHVLASTHHACVPCSPCVVAEQKDVYEEYVETAMEEMAEVCTLAYFCRVWDRRHPDLRVSKTSHFQECPACVALYDMQAGTRDLAARAAITKVQRWHLEVSDPQGDDRSDCTCSAACLLCVVHQVQHLLSVIGQVQYLLCVISSWLVVMHCMCMSTSYGVRRSMPGACSVPPAAAVLLGTVRLMPGM